MAQAPGQPGHQAATPRQGKELAHALPDVGERLRGHITETQGRQVAGADLPGGVDEQVVEAGTATEQGVGLQAGERYHSRPVWAVIVLDVEIAECPPFVRREHGHLAA